MRTAIRTPPPSTAPRNLVGADDYDPMLERGRAGLAARATSAMWKILRHLPYDQAAELVDRLERLAGTTR